MMQQHPLSAKFPALPDEQYQILKDSIESIGVQNPITIYEGMVIDGWHRYRAATELVMACPSVELDADIDPRDFVLAQNRARRHITAAQLALAATEVYKWRSAGNPEFSNSALSAELGASIKDVAKVAGVSERTLRQAKAVHVKAVEEVQQAVKDGAIGLTKAAEIAKLPKEEQAAAIDKPLPKKHEEPEPEQVDVEQSEIDEMQADLERYYKMLESDDALKTLADENKQLKAEVRVLRSRINGLMAENAEAIKTAKRYQYQVDRLKKEQAHV